MKSALVVYLAVKGMKGRQYDDSVKAMDEGFVSRHSFFWENPQDRHHYTDSIRGNVKSSIQLLTKYTSPVCYSMKCNMT